MHALAALLLLLTIRRVDLNIDISRKRRHPIIEPKEHKSQQKW